jgi:DNA-binding beta-propeller fold protein YncE
MNLPNTFCLLLVAAITGFPSQSLGFEKVEYVREVRTGLQEPVDLDLAVNGDVYVLDKEASKVFVFDASGKPKLDFGRSGSDPGQLDEPEAIALSPKGQVFVTDTENDRIQAYDVSGKFLFHFGSSGDQPGQLNEPTGLAIDQFGIIYVADRNNQRIQTFSHHGIFLQTFNLEAPPSDIAIDTEGNILALIPDTLQIMKINPQNQKRELVYQTGQRPDFLSSGSGIAVDMRGDIYITERSGDSIKKIDTKGNLLVAFGSEGEGRGQFDDPGGMTTDRQGFIYIADSDNHRVQVFHVTGSQKSARPIQTQSPPIIEFDALLKAEKAITDLFYVPTKGLYVLSQKHDHILRLDSPNQVYGRKGGKPGEFEDPMALAASSSGELAIADTGNDRVQLLDPEGAPSYQFGTSGEKTGQFDEPAGIAISKKNLIYVADTENHRIQIFNKDGIFLTSFGRESDKITPQTPEHGKFNRPTALAINSQHQVYVLDRNNHRVQLFEEEGQFIKGIGSKGRRPGQFLEPVDITVDEQDNLYVADQGNHRIQVFNPQSQLIFMFGTSADNQIFGFSFGAPREPQPGIFSKVSAITTFQGKVYVADARSDHIQVFQFHPTGLVQEERFFVTKSAFPPHDSSQNATESQRLAKESALQQALEELAVKTSLTKDQLEHALRIERIESLPTGAIQVTVSIAKPLLNKDAKNKASDTKKEEPTKSEEFILQ